MSAQLKAPPRMSGSEVLGCVELVTAAFTDAADLVGRLSRKQKKRKGERNYHEVLLYQVLEQGGKQIQDAYDQGFRQLGTAFRLGDDLARERLLCVAIEVNSDIVQSLQVACAADKAEPDLIRLHDTAITSRHDAVRCLNDLRDRVQKFNGHGDLPHLSPALASPLDGLHSCVVVPQRSPARPATSHNTSMQPPEKSGLRRMLSNSPNSSPHRRTVSDSPAARPTDNGLLPAITPVTPLEVDVRPLTTNRPLSPPPTSPRAVSPPPLSTRAMSPPPLATGFQFPSPTEPQSASSEQSSGSSASRGSSSLHFPAPPQSSRAMSLIANSHSRSPSTESSRAALPAARTMSLVANAHSRSPSTDSARIMASNPRPADMSAYEYYRTHIRQASADTIVSNAQSTTVEQPRHPLRASSDGRRRPTPISVPRMSFDDAVIMEQLTDPRPAPPPPSAKPSTMQHDLQRFPSPPVATSRFASPSSDVYGFPSPPPPPTTTGSKIAQGAVPIASSAPHSARSTAAAGPGPLVPAPIAEVEDNDSIDGRDYDKDSVYSQGEDQIEPRTPASKRISADSDNDSEGYGSPVSPMSERPSSNGSFRHRSVSPVSPITEYSPSSYGPHGNSGAYSYTYKPESADPSAASVKSAGASSARSASQSGASGMQESIGMFEYGRYEDYDHWKAELADKLREAKSKDVKRQLQEEGKEKLRLLKEEEKMKLKALKEGEKENKKEEAARKKEEKERLKAEKRKEKEKEKAKRYVPLSSVAVGGGAVGYTSVKASAPSTSTATSDPTSADNRRPSTAKPLPSPAAPLKQFSAVNAEPDHIITLPEPPKVPTTSLDREIELSLRQRSNTMASTWSRESSIKSYQTHTSRKKGLFRFGSNVNNGASGATSAASAANKARKVQPKSASSASVPRSNNGSAPLPGQIEIGRMAEHEASRKKKLEYEKYRRMAFPVGGMAI